MKDRTSIKIMSNEKGGYVVFFFGKEAQAKLEAGDCIDNVGVTAFDVQCRGGEISTLSISLLDGKPKAVCTLEE